MSHKGNDKLIDDIMDRETKRPEKKVMENEQITDGEITPDKIIGYNQAHDEWEAYLPSEEEIAKILFNTHYDLNACGGECDCTRKECAKAISKRIRG